jgi:kynureninase
MPIDRQALEAMDAADPLAGFRGRFLLPEEIIYLDGNSLGALPAATPGRIERLIREEWGRSLIRGWLAHGWMDMPAALGAKIARLVGAAPDEVLVAGTTSVNVFMVLAAALALRPGRRTILSDRQNFPSDLYMAEGLAGLLGGGCRLRLVEEAEVAGAIDGDTAAVMLTEVNYRSGRRHDMARITDAAHAAGALAIWDLAHSAGAMPVDLNRPIGLDGRRLGGEGADFAVGCGYKYLSGGPGAPAFLFVARRWQELVRPALPGWLGHERPFDLDLAFRPAPGIRRMVCSTPSVLAAAALECGLDVLIDADIAEIRAKSLALAEVLITLVEEVAAPFGVTLASPRDGARRGSQVSFAHPEGYAVMQALIARGVIGDFRAPDLMRFGLTPLTLRFVDMGEAARALGEVLASRAFEHPRFRDRAAVT